MKDTPESHILSVTNPVTDKSFDFKLEDENNISLVMRLIRKRSELKKSSRLKFKKLLQIREDKNVADIEKEISDLSISVSNLEKEEDETEEEFKERSEEVLDKLRELQKKYPKESLKLQDESEELISKAETIGYKICCMILNPIEDIPEDYLDKESFIEDFIFDDETVEEIIAFFLTTFTFSTKSQEERTQTVKIRKA